MSSIRVLFSCPTLRAPRKSSAFIIKTVIILAALAVPEFFPALAQAQQMKLLTPSTGWVSNNGHLYWTTDSGSHWADITPIPPNAHVRGVGLLSVYLLNTQEGWAIISYPETVVPVTPQSLRTRGTIYDIAQTVDGGQTWSFLPLTYPPLAKWQEDVIVGPSSLYFLDSQRGWMVMAFTGNSQPGKLLSTQDGGRTWNWVNSPGLSGIIQFTSPQSGWLLGGPYDQLFNTRDGGKSWHEAQLPVPPQVGAAKDATVQAPPTFEDSEHGLLAVHYSGPEQTPAKLAVYSTTDSGETWKPVKVVPEAHAIGQGVKLPFALVGSVLFVATGGEIVKVGRVPLAGDVETSVTASGTGTAALSFADPNNGWALGMGGKLLGTADGGETWRNITPWQVFTPASAPSGPGVSQPQAQTEETQPGASLLPSPSVQSQGGKSNLHASMHLGFDRTDVLSTADMAKWWTYSPYYDVYIYLPGSPNRHIDSTLTSGWVNTIKSQGWGLVSIWFGKQPYCVNDTSNITDFISSDPTTAAGQGLAEAMNAVNAAVALGLSKTIIYKDMEPYNESNAQCGSTGTAYVGAWDQELKAEGYTAGVYGTPTAAASHFVSASTVPDDVWLTHFDSKATIFDPRIADSLWPAGQRSRQYIVEVTGQPNVESYGGTVNYHVDRDIEDAPVDGADGTKIYTYPDATFHVLANGADQVVPGGINNAHQGESPMKYGQISGSDYYSSPPTNSSFWWDNGNFTPLNFNNAFGLNSPPRNNPSKFQIVASYNYDANAYLYDVATSSFSALDYPGATNTIANDVNDDVQIVGFYQDGSGNSYGFIDDAGNFSTLVGLANASGINGFGQVAGTSNGHGYVYENGQPIQQIDCKGASDTDASKINNNELVVGTCVVHDVQKVYVYDLHGKQMILTFTYPGSSGSIGEGINDSGQISGWWGNSSVSSGFYVAPSHQ
jgi:photosystem II stability/assembly factor-like uncharacterized protein